MGNVQRAAAFEWNRELAKLGKPVDRDEWVMTPQTVNAYYNPSMNEIVFPGRDPAAAVLQLAADDAVNYGGIGAVIGHEIGHGFDDQGSKWDGAGNLVDWWTPADRAEFDRARARPGGAVRPLRAVPRLQGQRPLTLGENIGRPGRRDHRLRGLPLVAGRQARPGHRRPHRRSALLHGLGPGVARASIATPT